MKRALAGPLRVLGPPASVGIPPGAPGLTGPPVVSPAVTVPVLTVTATAAIPVSPSLPGPFATLLALGLPAGLALALSIAASAAVASPAGVMTTIVAISAAALAPRAKVGNPTRRPLIADIDRQADDCAARDFDLLRRQRGPIVGGDLNAWHVRQEAPHGSVRPRVHAMCEDPAGQRPKPILEIVPKMVQVHRQGDALAIPPHEPGHQEVEGVK